MIDFRKLFFLMVAKLFNILQRAASTKLTTFDQRHGSCRMHHILDTMRVLGHFLDPRSPDRSPTHLLAAVIMDRLLALHDEVPVQTVGRLPVMAIGRCHLPCRLAEGHAPEPRPHRRQGRDLDLLIGRAVMRRGSPAGPPRSRCRPCRSPRYSPGPSSSGRGPGTGSPGGRWARRRPSRPAARRRTRP